MKRLISCLAGGFIALASPILVAQSDYQVPRTEYDQPNLQGVWNFASHTPVQRNESLGDREYFTTEENEENRERSVTTFEARAESHFDGVGGYNSFWYERATIGYDLRTCLLYTSPSPRDS